MYYEDLSTVKPSYGPSMINVGWLGDEIEETFTPPEEFLEALFQVCTQRKRATRGYHSCPFCKEYGFKVTKNEQTIYLGDAEIDVQRNENEIFVSPNMIYHYVEKHGYKPPREFIEAIMQNSKYS